MALTCEKHGCNLKYIRTHKPESGRGIVWTQCHKCKEEYENGTSDVVKGYYMFSEDLYNAKKGE